ncbi:hypothetical protein ABGB16_02945 [Micromonospora sp. B11E3]|uniref:hypothetical protein n=1 Tax=Micromonospora sp. B11E3 TaxID=3153562 RepID=UPI00325EA764
MAGLGWGGSIATAVGVAAGAGAAQLGVGYGLGIINWTAADATAGEAVWVAGLAWSTWIAGTSTIAGAVCAQRLRQPVSAGRDELLASPAPETVTVGADATVGPSSPAEGWTARPTGDGGPGTAVVLALAGAVGALLTVLLVAVPARAASLPGVSAPQTVAACYAGVGLLLGLLAAVWALRSPAAATNVIATVGWLWGLAVVAVLDDVLSGRGLTSAQLGIWQLGADSPSFWIRDWFYWPGALLALGSAALIGALAARRAARSPQRRLGAAASGAAGPLLVALAYLLAAPGLTAIGREQVSAHLVAPYAVVAGFAGSMLTAALAQRAGHRRPDTPAAIPRQRTGEADDAPTAQASGSAGSGEPTEPDGSEPAGAAGQSTGQVCTGSLPRWSSA